MNKVMTAQEVSAMLRVSYGAFRQMMRRGDDRVPPWFLVGSRKRWHSTTVEEWMRESEHKASVINTP